MKTRALAATFLAVALLAGPSHAAIHFVDLGTGAPPASVGPVPVTPFLLGPQQAIPDFTLVNNIPGNPFGGSVGLSATADKRTVGQSWGTWSHGFTGPVFFVSGSTVT